MYLIRDGVKLYYEKIGCGERTFVLIHGTSGYSEHMHHIAKFLAQTAQVVSIDLRGHGQSDQPKQTYSIQGYAQDIIWMCNELNLVHPTLLGLSMGGNIAIEIAGSYPDFPAAVILLDSFMLYSSEVRKIIQYYIDGLKGSAAKTMIEEIIRNSCLPWENLIYEQLLKDALDLPQNIWVDSLTSMMDWDFNFAEEKNKKMYHAGFIHRSDEPSSGF